jgi:hypothetical protein
VLTGSLHHPKQLSIAQREKIVREGLGDRDPAVRQAASKLISHWVDTLDGSLEEFLMVFDLVGESEAEGVAESALKSVFGSRKDLVEKCDFNGSYVGRISATRVLTITQRPTGRLSHPPRPFSPESSLNIVLARTTRSDRKLLSPLSLHLRSRSRLHTTRS